MSIHLTLQQLLQIALYVFVLMIVWTIIRFAFKLTMKMFWFGSGAILVLGLILVLLRLLGGG